MHSSGKQLFGWEDAFRDRHFAEFDAILVVDVKVGEGDAAVCAFANRTASSSSPGMILRMVVTFPTRRHSKHPFVHQRFAEGQGFLTVNLQDADRRPADGGAADEHRAVIAEMVRPFVAAGVEQAGQLLGQRV